MADELLRDPAAADRPTVIILGLADAPPADACGITGPGGAGCCGSEPSGGTAGCTAPSVRVPVLACRDALRAGGAIVEIVTAGSDSEIDAVIARLDGPARPDGLTWPSSVPSSSGVPSLVVAAASDGQLRAVVRRMVRRWAPLPSRRPADLATGRTLPDLPPIGILPLDATGRGSDSPGTTGSDAGGRGTGGSGAGRRGGAPADLADRLGLPRDPADVAKAVLAGLVRRVDLFRNDGGSITLHGALFGGVDASGAAAGWRGRVELDDMVLADGREPVLACAVANANGYTRIDDVALAPNADPCSGTITAAVAVPVVLTSRFGRRTVRIEVRRATGRAVSVTPVADLPFVDDGVAGTLTRKRAWWVEPGAWAVYSR